jgi:hypothetical protein
MVKVGLMRVIYRATCKLNGDDSIAVFTNLIVICYLRSLADETFEDLI